MTAVGLPRAFGVALDADTRELDDGALCGGLPLRVLRLTPAGRRAYDELVAPPGTVADDAQAVLARRLVDSGLAHPRPPVPAVVDVTVVVPVRDRAAELDSCLAVLGGEHPVVVVDDGSVDPPAVAAVATRHGARLVSRPRNGGPAAARNSALAALDTELVAFVDSDCTPPPGWLDALAGHFADPLVAAVAPRVVPARVRTGAERYAVRHGCLDLGPREAAVAPGSRVAYVPTAALLVRRSALAELGGFDAALRYGEDVDLVWRLHAHGWRVRYDPSVRVPHREPSTWPALLARRFRYGTAAGPLARRHGTAMAPLRVPLWPTLALLAVAARRPLPAALAATGAAVVVRRSARAAGLSGPHTARLARSSARRTWSGVARYARQFGGPVLLAALFSRRARPVALAVLLSPPDPRRLADDVSYGLGVVAGAWRARTLVPVRPVVVRPSRKENRHG